MLSASYKENCVVFVPLSWAYFTKHDPEMSLMGSSPKEQKSRSKKSALSRSLQHFPEQPRCRNNRNITGGQIKNSDAYNGIVFYSI